MNFGALTKTLEKYLPQILAGIGVACTVAATIKTVKDSEKIVEAKNNAEEELALIPEEDHAARLKTYAVNFVPVMAPIAALQLLGTGASIKSTMMLTKRNTALAVAYTGAEAMLSSYTNKVRKTLGEEAHTKVMSEVAKHDSAKVDSTSKTVIATGYGNDLFKDMQTGQVFRSTKDAVLQAALDAFQDNVGAPVYLNDFLSLVGEDEVTLGSDRGWDASKGQQLHVTFYPGESANGELCWEMSYESYLMW